MQREGSDSTGIFGQRGDLAAALKDLDGALRRREDELAARPDGVGDWLADLDMSLELVRVDRVDSGIAFGSCDGRIVPLEGERRGVGDGQRCGGRSLESREFLGRRPAFGNGALLARLGEPKLVFVVSG